MIINCLEKITTMADECSNCPVENFGLGGRGFRLVAPSLLGPSIAMLLVSNRLYWRFRMLGRFGLDDVATILATVRYECSFLRE